MITNNIKLPNELLEKIWGYTHQDDLLNVMALNKSNILVSCLNWLFQQDIVYLPLQIRCLNITHNLSLPSWIDENIVVHALKKSNLLQKNIQIHALLINNQAQPVISDDFLENIKNEPHLFNNLLPNLSSLQRENLLYYYLIQLGNPFLLSGDLDAGLLKNINQNVKQISSIYPFLTYIQKENFFNTIMRLYDEKVTHSLWIIINKMAPILDLEIAKAIFMKLAKPIAKTVSEFDTIQIELLQHEFPAILGLYANIKNEVALNDEIAVNIVLQNIFNAIMAGLKKQMPYLVMHAVKLIPKIINHLPQFLLNKLLLQINELLDPTLMLPQDIPNNIYEIFHILIPFLSLTEKQAYFNSFLHDPFLNRFGHSAFPQIFASLFVSLNNKQKNQCFQLLLEQSMTHNFSQQDHFAVNNLVLVHLNEEQSHISLEFLKNFLQTFENQRININNTIPYLLTLITKVPNYELLDGLELFFASITLHHNEAMRLAIFVNLKILKPLLHKDIWQKYFDIATTSVVFNNVCSGMEYVKKLPEYRAAIVDIFPDLPENRQNEYLDCLVAIYKENQDVSIVDILDNLVFHCKPEQLARYDIFQFDDVNAPNRLTHYIGAIYYRTTKILDKLHREKQDCTVTDNSIIAQHGLFAEQKVNESSVDLSIDIAELKIG